MSEAGALLHAILAGHVDGETEALLHLEAALALEVDPLDYCANRFGLGDVLVMERAAAWAGLAFAPKVPNTLPGSLVIERIERLGEVRTLRAKLFEREVVYSAPRFGEFLKLRRHVELHPEFRRHFCVVPAVAIRAELAAASEEELLDEARQRLVRRWPRASGSVSAPTPVRVGFAAGVTLLLLFALLAPSLSRPAFLPMVGAILVIPALLRFWAAVSRSRAPPPPAMLSDAELPVYTVLVPLRDEAPMVGQLAKAMRNLDYPPEKLDVRFVVESRSAATVAAVRKELFDPRFELLVVPDALPRTKPKALNYAMPLVSGEYIVVYDAEDIPDPGQLRLAASTFAEQPEIDCLQAELVIDNARESLLAALFAGEYAGQFGLMLPLLARLELPMPLGGTSNHFRIETLRRLGGWDSFNVTEDADLGVRLARRGLKTATIESRTGEEAPLVLGSWLKQRTRWMKGWMSLSTQINFVNVYRTLRESAAQAFGIIATLSQHFDGPAYDSPSLSRREQGFDSPWARQILPPGESVQNMSNIGAGMRLLTRLLVSPSARTRYRPAHRGADAGEE
ncbi:MAG: glycosyltransferase [Devosia sp.]|uniref:glycosyltransferase family 2 protein n=1 Tax=Devosia sp. TaxID=1871048 RepID=UPI00261E12FF|nr:glycosyltransferase [Devosia sp.]MDB5538780.1 glycosyltransferase [Devosia sp.]